MSVYVNNNNQFEKFFGTTIMSLVKNKDDFLPLFKELQTIKEIKTVNTLHYRLYDVFSQTLASFTGETCPKVEEWLYERGMSHNPYKPLDYDVILPTHYDAKNIINDIFPQNFVICENLILKRKNNKIVLTFTLNPQDKLLFKKIIKSLNHLYRNTNSINYQIILGYITNEQLKISDYKLESWNTLIPKKIYIHAPDVYHYKNIDSYYLYSCNMF